MWCLEEFSLGYPYIKFRIFLHYVLYSLFLLGESWWISFLNFLPLFSLYNFNLIEILLRKFFLSFTFTILSIISLGSRTSYTYLRALLNHENSTHAIFVWLNGLNRKNFQWVFRPLEYFSVQFLGRKKRKCTRLGTLRMNFKLNVPEDDFSSGQ